MNAKDRYKKLKKEWENFDEYDLSKIWDVGDDMATTIEALRELNIKQFQEIGRLTKIIRRRGNAIREHIHKEERQTE